MHNCDTWKKGDLLILKKIENMPKGYKIGTRFSLCNDYNTYVNILYLEIQGYKFSIRKEEILDSFLNLNEHRNEVISKILE